MSSVHLPRFARVGGPGQPGCACTPNACVPWARTPRATLVFRHREWRIEYWRGTPDVIGHPAGARGEQPIQPLTAGVDPDCLEDVLPFARFPAGKVRARLVPRYGADTIRPLFDVQVQRVLVVRDGARERKERAKGRDGAP